jgi:charged multivesicular body protein 4
MMTVEREIGSIESANINKETLDAMKNASNAIKQIHGGLTVDQVDQTMEDLREQHAVGEEIAEALTQGAGTMGVDEDELDEELAELQQEQLDERMLKTGSVPVSDQINRMPSAPSKCSEIMSITTFQDIVLTNSCSKEHCVSRGGGRGGRAAEIAGRDGYVKEVHLSDRLDGVNFSEDTRVLYTLLPFSHHSGGAVLPQSLRGRIAIIFLTFTNTIFPMHYSSSWKWFLTISTPTNFP